MFEVYSTWEKVLMKIPPILFKEKYQSKQEKSLKEFETLLTIVNNEANDFLRKISF